MQYENNNIKICRKRYENEILRFFHIHYKIEIKKSLKLILSRAFRKKIKSFSEPLLATSPSEKIYNEITNFNFHEETTKKFYDLDLEKNE